jgi:hypothetical protein
MGVMVEWSAGISSVPLAACRPGGGLGVEDWVSNSMDD